MDRETCVHVELGGGTEPVGRLYTHVRRGRETVTFEYETAWLNHAERFALDPALKLGPGPFHSRADRPLFGAIDEEDPTASLDLALGVAGYFDLDSDAARQIAGEVGRAVADWHRVAAGRGIGKAEIERMESAFANA